MDREFIEADDRYSEDVPRITGWDVFGAVCLVLAVLITGILAAGALLVTIARWVVAR